MPQPTPGPSVTAWRTGGDTHLGSRSLDSPAFHPMGAQQVFADLITGSESHVRPWTNFKDLFFFWCILLLLFLLGFFLRQNLHRVKLIILK